MSEAYQSVPCLTRGHVHEPSHRFSVPEEHHSILNSSLVRLLFRQKHTDRPTYPKVPKQSHHLRSLVYSVSAVSQIITIIWERKHLKNASSLIVRLFWRSKKLHVVNFVGGPNSPY
jgi:hypothetical protein